MAVSLQAKYPLRPITNIPRSRRPSLLRVRVVTCSVTTTTKPQPNHEKLVVERHIVKPPLSSDPSLLSNKPQPKLVVEQRLANPPLSNDPTLKSTWNHRLWVAAGCTTLFVSLAKSVTGGIGSHLWLEPALAGYAGYILADLGSGVYHWAIDNYGDESTPVVGTQIEAFQGHHKWPWTITRRQFANNLHALARVITFTVLPLDLAFNDPVVHGFVCTFAFCIMFSQQFHAWAHGTKSKLPPLVVVLQDMGLLVSRRQHAEHHRAPYNNNYCIVSGAWNNVLDESKVFEALEMVLYFQLGVRPRSWSEPHSDWTEETEISNNNQA
ncbi:PREDICTED: fatty acid desaturase 4, chloroplastic-like [Camelina sativa]|uniref:Fatty acid desaturase 4, chloroplastic-like n=1 Tax=Camelina sativa TaxID=90675 RepID=A0ABM0UYI4_CAMSA|nr:PREDICTED: fatty acid desaturase 4, chloroplastic-like [Camelina sativa]